MQSNMEYIQAQLEDSIKFFRNKRNYNRIMSISFVIASSSLSAVATIAIGASKTLDIHWLAIVALVSSGMATVTAAWEALLAHRKLWDVNNMALAALDKLNRDMGYRCSHEAALTNDEIDEFYKRYDDILSDADAAWVRTYSATSAPAAKK